MAIEIAKLIATVGADIGGFEREMNRANGLLGGMSGTMRTALIGAAAAGGAALVGLGAKSVSVASDFESQMNVLSVAAAGGGASLEDLRSAALAMGSDVSLVGINASQSADAMTNFAKAGLDTSAMFGDLQGYLAGTTELGGALKAAVDLAAASELDLAGASEVVTVAMSTFGLSADEASGIANSFVQAADASVAEVSDLAAALTTLGPTAAAMGMSLEETNQALAILSTRGIAGAEAGTALKSMLMNMTSAPADSYWAEIGTSMYDAEGNMKSLITVLGELEVATAGMTQMQRDSLYANLAGSYGVKALNTLVAEGTTGYDAMGEAISSAATAQEVAAARTQGFEAAMEQLGGAVETFMINVGTPLIENFLTPGVKLLTDWITELGNMVPSQEAVSAAFETVKSAIGGVIDTVTGIVESGDPLGALWTLISGAIATEGPKLATSLSGVVQGMVDTAVAYVSDNVGTWSDTIGAWLGTAVSGAVTWVTGNVPVYAASLWTTLKGWVDGAVGSIGANAGTWADSVGSWLGSMLSGAVTWITTNGVTYASELWASVKGWIDGAVASLAAEGGAIGNDIGTSLGTAVSGAITWLTANVPTYAADLWAQFSTVLSDGLTLFSDNAGTWGNSYGEIVGTVIRTAIGGIALLVGELWAAIQSLFNSATGEGEGGESKASMLATGLISLFTGFWNGFITGITGDPQWKESLSAWIDTTILQPFRDIDLIAPIKTAFQGIITGVEEKAEDISTAIQDIVDRILNPFKNLDLMQIGRDMMAGLKNGIADAAGSVTDAAKNAAGNAVDTAKSFLGIGSPSKVFADIGADLMRGMELGIERNAYRPAVASGQAASNVTNTFNLNANYGGQMPGNLEGLLTQLLQGMRGRGYSVPLPDMGA